MLLEGSFSLELLEDFADSVSSLSSPEPSSISSSELLEDFAVSVSLLVFSPCSCVELLAFFDDELDFSIFSELEEMSDEVSSCFGWDGESSPQAIKAQANARQSRKRIRFMETSC